MTHRHVFSTPAIVLRKTVCGESDVVATFFSLALGKISCFAKSAKSSVRRFHGGLDIFNLTDIAAETFRQGDLYWLKESVVRNSFQNIRNKPLNMAYAGYWCELIERWTEPSHPHPDVFHLLSNCLQMLGSGDPDPQAVSILFQLHFLKLTGLSPELTQCRGCGVKTNDAVGDRLGFDLEKGGVLCHKCRSSFAHVTWVSKGTVMQLKWIQERHFPLGARMRFTRRALNEGLGLLEAFLPRHLGCAPRSLICLSQVRSAMGEGLPRAGSWDGACKPGEIEECPF